MTIKVKIDSNWLLLFIVFKKLEICLCITSCKGRLSFSGDDHSYGFWSTAAPCKSLLEGLRYQICGVYSWYPTCLPIYQSTVCFLKPPIRTVSCHPAKSSGNFKTLCSRSSKCYQLGLLENQDKVIQIDVIAVSAPNFYKPLI